MTSKPSTSSSSTFTPRFCSFRNEEIVLVRQNSGKYSKFRFDHSKNQFQPVECPDCRVIPTESDLLPLYPAWSNRLERYIIFAKNLINERIEQYVYDRNYEGFQQVLQPELQYDPKRSHDHHEFFTVGGSEMEGVTRIRRDSRGRFRKEQMNWATRQFRVIPAVPVRVLEGVGVETGEKSPKSNMPSTRKRKEASEEKENLKEIDEKEPDESDFSKETETKKQRRPEVEIVAVNRSKLSNNDIAEIRRLAALMGNPTEADSSDEVSDSDDVDYDDVPDEDVLFDVVESSC